MEESIDLQVLLARAKEMAMEWRHQFVMPEHFLLALCDYPKFKETFEIFGDGILFEFYADVWKFLESCDIEVPMGIQYEVDDSVHFRILRDHVIRQALAAEVRVLTPAHYVMGILNYDDFSATLFFKQHLESLGDFMAAFIDACGADNLKMRPSQAMMEEDDDFEWLSNGSSVEDETEKESADSLPNFLTCINEQIADHNPLIGREPEMERTIQVLCRREKNNPIHIGEAGVGKTALIYGLAALIEEGRVPARLRNHRIYQLDLGGLIAGTQYRGEFEKRLKNAMTHLTKEENAIVYIDEIHQLIGAGKTGEGAMDASNFLKPYLEGGKLRFIGATTYEEYNRYFTKNSGLMRRFQKIDIEEPTVEEAIRIVEALRERYEAFHGVRFAEGAVEHAVRMSHRYLNDRRLPDKAIDLIDEAATYLEVHPEAGSEVTNELVNDVLAKMCRVDALRDIENEDTTELETLETRILSQIYGQDQAVKEVVESVQMMRAGLLEDDKPVANLLFVGPTGVGKTQLAKSLSKELGVELLRFDMSEYAEKHTVARLIGSPAGYVGYEDGGLLTDAIRKTPHCVLLLDEIEKAHADIFNLLLQVMDYASLTDSKGRKADFRHVILIMTSNAGAQFARQASVGFGGYVSAGDAMMKAVKKTFKPEFLNRLSATVVFNDMDRKMAELILNKKLRQLRERLVERKVELQLTDAAMEHLLSLGYTAEYGAREMDRMISTHLKPLLTRAILFGNLKEGGEAVVDCVNGKLTLK